MFYRAQNSDNSVVSEEPTQRLTVLTNKKSTNAMVWNKERIAADELFALFTASIIKEKTIFTR